MKTRITALSLIFSFFILVSAHAQQQLADVASMVRSTVLNELYDNNSNNWILDNQYVSGRIENGQYILKCKNYKRSTGMSYIPVQIDQSRDFEIEAGIKIIKGSGGLVFGMNDKYDHYRVEFNTNNDLFIARNQPSKSKNDILFSSSKNQNIKPGIVNKITVAKFRNTYYVSVNGSLIKELNNIQLDGNLVGFNTGKDSEISAEYFKVSYLEKKVVPIIAEKKLSTTDSIQLNVQKTGAVTKSLTDNKIITSSDSPVIIWTSPSAERTNYDLFTARISAKVKSVSELSSVAFYVNGSPRGEAERRSAPGESDTYIIEKTVNLDPGDNTIYFTATNDKGTNKSDYRYFVIPEATKPKIIWSNPSQANMSTNTELINIEACINSPSGLKSVRVLVNGESTGEDKVFKVSSDQECNIKFQRSIILKENTDNSIYIVAENIAGPSTSENRIIRYSKVLAQKRLALVIGNSNYGSKPPLKNPINDANLMQATLKQLDFEVIKCTDLRLDSMEAVFRRFSKLMRDYNVVLFYYAGHGVQVDGQNYLLPVNAKIEKKEDCSLEAFNVDRLMDEFVKYPANTNIAILDACRSNPFTTFVRGEATTFVPISNANGTIILYAAAPGTSATDGLTANGLFTEELVNQMDIHQNIESVCKNTRIKVLERSKGAQRPQYTNDLIGDFYFK